MLLVLLCDCPLGIVPRGTRPQLPGISPWRPCISPRSSPRTRVPVILSQGLLPLLVGFSATPGPGSKLQVGLNLLCPSLWGSESGPDSDSELTGLLPAATGLCPCASTPFVPGAFPKQRVCVYLTDGTPQLDRGTWPVSHGAGGPLCPKHSHLLVSSSA